MASMRVAAVPAQNHEPLAEEHEQLLDVDSTSMPLRRRWRQAAVGALALTAACVLLGATLPGLHMQGLAKARSPDGLSVSKQYVQELIQKAEQRSTQSGPLLERAMHLAKLPGPRTLVPTGPVDHDREWQEGLCFINVWIALEKLALIGMTIDSAVMDCDDTSKAACAADISGIYASVSAAGAYLTGISSTCPEAFKNAQEAACVAAIFQINYGVGTLAAAFAAIGACEPENIEKKMPQKEVPEHLNPITDALEEKRENSIGMCVINVNQAASYIGRATIAIRDATQKCKDQGINEKGEHAASCAVQVSSVIQSFALIEAYLANAATQCGETAIVAAGCANRVGAIVAGMAEISGGSSSAALSCDPPKDDDDDDDNQTKS